MIPERTLMFTGFYNPNNSNGDLGIVGDINGDGADDFYYYDSRPSDLVTIYLGDRNWDFQVAYLTQGDPIFSGESVPRGNTYGDFNGDDFDDYSTISSGVTKFYFGSAEPDTIPDLLWEGDYVMQSSMGTDFNNDGACELFNQASVSTMRVNLGGEFPSPIPAAELTAAGCTASGIVEVQNAGDFNGDGYDDIVTSSTGCNGGFGRFAVFAGGPYIRTTPIWTMNGSVGGLEGIQYPVGIGDVNGDGVDDLAVGCWAGINLRGNVIIFSGDTTLYLPADEVRPIVGDFTLSIYPNPFNSTLSISLDVPLHQDVTLSLYDLLGREVDVVYRGRLSSSTISYVAPAAMASGVYFLRASAGTQSVLGKVVLLK